MKRISSIRSGLEKIAGAIRDFPPEPGYRGDEPGVQVPRTIWGENHQRDIQEFGQEGSDSFEDEIDHDSDSGVGQGLDDIDPVIEVGPEIEEKLPVLGGEAGEEIRKSVLHLGTDALGWYVSFHYPGRQWGAYVSMSGIAYLCVNVFAGLPISLDVKARLAFHAILSHELFHFATEYTIAQAELVHLEPWYVPRKIAMHSGPPGYCEDEEALANAYMLHAFRSGFRVSGKQEALRGFVKAQPRGYCYGAQMRPRDLDWSLEDLARHYGKAAAKSCAHPILWEVTGPYDWSAQFPIRPRIDWRYCPIHLVDDTRRFGIPPGWISFFSNLRAIHESDEFRKKLMTMSDPIQRAWERTKRKLQTAITSGCDFKRVSVLGADLWSVRINDNFRAHLKRVDSSGEWEAVSIGSHKEMGHG